MKNFEYFEKEIKEIANKKDGISLKDNKVAPCMEIKCKKCEFWSEDGCSANVLNWLYAEHVEPPKISKRTKMFFDSIETGWVARDKNGNLFLYPYIKPYKLDDETEEGWVLNEACDFMLLTGLSFLTLDFIKWEDAEPWSVEDIRELEVEE